MSSDGIPLFSKLNPVDTGFIAMYATLASRDVDCCLIPESPFYLEGAGGLFEYIEKRLKEDGHMVIVIAEGAGQELLSESLKSSDQQDASGNSLLHDVGIWISQKIKVYILVPILFVCMFNKSLFAGTHANCDCSIAPTLLFCCRPKSELKPLGVFVFILK